MKHSYLVVSILLLVSVACQRRPTPPLVQADNPAQDTAALQVVTSGYATWDELTPQGKAGAIRALNRWLLVHLTPTHHEAAGKAA